MKYLGWILAVIFAVALVYVYKVRYLPLRSSVAKLEQEIAMWEDVLKGQKGLSGDRYRFPPERFFKDDKLTPYAEIDILRNFDLHYLSLELYITAPEAHRRTLDIMRFLNEQRIVYKNMYIQSVIDSLERFEYKLTQ
jgi:hypothetical protein